MRRSLGLVCLLVALSSPAAALDDGRRFVERLDYNFLFGFGFVGAAQYDQGDAKLMATINATGFYRPTKSLSLGGLGLAVRATLPPDAWFFESDNFNEFGVGVPVVTYHSGRYAAQAGVEIQRINFQKNFYYAAAGIRWSPKRRPVRAAR